MKDFLAVREHIERPVTVLYTVHLPRKLTLHSADSTMLTLVLTF